MKGSRAVVAGIVLAALAPGQAQSQGGDQARFVASLVDAINSRSPERRQALLHPKSLPCASAQPESFFHWMVTHQARDAVPPGYKWTITRIPPDQPLLFEDRFDYPVRPTHRLQLDFDASPSHHTTLLFQLIHEANHWYDLAACPKPETMAADRAARPAGAEAANRIRALVDGMSPQVKDSVLDLVKAGRRIEAVRRYQEASGQDLTTAVGVVDLLTSSGR